MEVGADASSKLLGPTTSCKFFTKTEMGRYGGKAECVLEIIGAIGMD